jgi:hypothetical protein
MINRLLFTGLTNAAQNRGYSINAREQLAFMTWKRASVNNRKSSSKYCENYSQMVKVNDKIRQPDLFTSIENVAQGKFFTIRLSKVDLES